MSVQQAKWKGTDIGHGFLVLHFSNRGNKCYWPRGLPTVGFLAQTSTLVLQPPHQCRERDRRGHMDLHHPEFREGCCHLRVPHPFELTPSLSLCFPLCVLSDLNKPCDSSILTWSVHLPVL